MTSCPVVTIVTIFCKARATVTTVALWICWKIHEHSEMTLLKGCGRSETGLWSVLTPD